MRDHHTFFYSIPKGNKTGLYFFKVREETVGTAFAGANKLATGSAGECISLFSCQSQDSLTVGANGIHLFPGFYDERLLLGRGQAVQQLQHFLFGLFVVFVF